MTQTCPYCGWTFDVTKRHEDERVLPYCSLGCRQTCEERHAPYEARKCEYREERDGAILPPDHEPEHLDGLADTEPEEQSAMRAFFSEWCRLPPETRDHIAFRLIGLPLWVIGELREISKQAVHKSINSKVASPRFRRVAALAGVDVAQTDDYGPLFG